MARGAARLIALVFLAGEVGARAAAPGWDDGQSFALEVRAHSGERFGLGKFDGWLPPRSEPVQAVIIHQHGCGANAGTASAAMARDAQWRALARQHHCALLVPRYDSATCADWNDPANGSDRALSTALSEWSARSGHAELATAPWLLWGHSGGASWTVQMVVRHPGRVLALALRGGAAGQLGDPAFRTQFIAASHGLPMIFVNGESERSPESVHHVSWEPFQITARDVRAAGGHVAWTVDPRTEHHCGDSRLVLIPYFESVLAAHAAGVKPAGVFVDESASTIVSGDATPDRGRGAWLPSRAVAEKWMEFVKTGTVTHVAAVTQAPELRGAVSPAGRIALTWRLLPASESGVRAVRIYRDGQLLREFGVGPADFIAEGGDTPPAELLATEWVDKSAQPGLTYDYAVAFTPCAGAESPRSATVRLRVPFPAAKKTS